MYNLDSGKLVKSFVQKLKLMHLHQISPDVQHLVCDASILKFNPDLGSEQDFTMILDGSGKAIGGMWHRYHMSEVNCALTLGTSLMLIYQQTCQATVLDFQH